MAPGLQVCFTLAALCALSATLLGDDNLAKYFDGLRSRGLLVIAEDYAVRQLGERGQVESRRRQLVTELAHTLSLHAELLVGKQRDEMYLSAKSYLETELTQPNLERSTRYQLRAEVALLDIDQARILSWEREFALQADQPQRIRELTSTSIHDLRQLLTERIEPDATFNRSQLEGLDDRVRLGISEAEILSALHTESLPDRTGALVTARSEYDGNLRRSGRTQLIRESRLGLVRLDRIQGNLEQAQAGLDNLSNIAAGDEFSQRVLAEQVRLRMTQNKLDIALQELTGKLRGRIDVSGELRELTIEVLIRSAELAGKRGEKQLQVDLLQQVERELTLVQGRYARQAAALLQQSREVLQYGPELTPLVRSGREAFARNDLVQAAEFFSQASAIAHRDGRADDAVEFGLTRGSIYLQANSSELAVTSLRQLYDAYPAHSRAADVHLLMCYALGRDYAAHPSDATLKAYAAALDVHRQTFVDKPSYGEASWLRGLLAQANSETATAIQCYLAVPTHHPRYAESLKQVVQIDRQELQRLLQEGAAADEQRTAAIQRLGTIVEKFPLPPAAWSMLQCELGLEGARLLMLGQQARYADADTVLQRIIESAEVIEQSARRTQTNVNPAWASLTRQAHQLRIISLAGQGQSLAARKLVDSLETTDPKALLDILNGLAGLTSHLPEQEQRMVGRMQQETASRLELRRQDLSQEEQLELDEIIAQSYVSAGDLGQAALIYERILKQQPQNARLISVLARLYEDRGGKDDLQKAQDWWTALEKQEVPGSVPWLTYRLSVLKVMHRRSDATGARKLLGVTKILYPQLGNPDVRQQYLELEKSLK